MIHRSGRGNNRVVPMPSLSCILNDSARVNKLRPQREIVAHSCVTSQPNPHNLKFKRKSGARRGRSYNEFMPRYFLEKNVDGLFRNVLIISLRTVEHILCL